MKNINLNKVIELIEHANNILILGHVNPDGDCIGAMAAMTLGLTSIKKNVTAWVKESIPLKYRFIKNVFGKPQENIINNFDLIIVLDTAVQTRVDIPFDFSIINRPVLSIDHHIANENTFSYVYADQSQAATVCLIFDILKKMNIEITKPIAEAIYTGILTDTGCFSYSNTDIRTFEISLELMKVGINPSEISSIIYNSFSKEYYKVLAEALNTIEFVANDRGAIMYVSAEMIKKYGLEKFDTEDFVNYPRSIATVDVACMVTEPLDGGPLRLNLRSKTPDINVRKLALKFNGGGHKCASGAKITEPLFDFLPKLKKELENFIKNEV